MKFGCEDPEAIRHLGRDQASYIIDRVKRDCSEMLVRQRNQAQTIVVIVVLGVASIVAALYWLLG